MFHNIHHEYLDESSCLRGVEAYCVSMLRFLSLIFYPFLRRRSRSKQKETADSQLNEGEFPADDDGNTSNSSTPIYERPDESVYPV